MRLQTVILQGSHKVKKYFDCREETSNYNLLLLSLKGIRTNNPECPYHSNENQLLSLKGGEKKIGEVTN